MKVANYMELCQSIENLQSQIKAGAPDRGAKMQELRRLKMLQMKSPEFKLKKKGVVNGRAIQ